MPKNWFSVERIAKLSSLKPGAKIHVIGVAGVAMAQLAIELARRGFVVSGSDKDYYEPTGTVLRESPVRLCHGYSAEHVPADVELVVIGNAVSYGNPECDVVEQNGVAYACFPSALEECLISGKHSVVVAGTHGKSTTTAMTAFVLRKLGADPSFFIGGVVDQLGTSLYRGSGDACVVEGDEYDSAFFAKVPKFRFYKAETAVVNAIEYDHADIYPDLASVEREFTWLVENVPASGRSFVCTDYESVRRLLPEWRSRGAGRIITFASGSEADIVISKTTAAGLGQRAEIQSDEFGNFAIELGVPGLFNVKNALVAVMVATTLGFDRAAAIAAIAEYRPVRRRQEVRFNRGGLVLIEDFAHHPTAVRETLQAIRAAFPEKKLWAVFEPRSNTSRRKVFQAGYLSAFAGSDVAILAHVEARSIDQGIELLDVQTLTSEIGATGVESHCIDGAQAIHDRVMNGVGANDVVVVMSNGSFGGLPTMLANSMTARAV